MQCSYDKFFHTLAERPKVRRPPEDKNITEEKHSRNLNIASSAREKGMKLKENL